MPVMILHLNTCDPHGPTCPPPSPLYLLINLNSFFSFFFLFFCMKSMYWASSNQRADSGASPLHYSLHLRTLTLNIKNKINDNSISWKVEPKLRGWGEDALSKWPSNPLTHMVAPTLTWLLNSQQEWEEAPLSRAHILMEPNWPLENADQSELRVRADSPNWGFMLSYGPIDPLYSEGWEETPNRGLIPSARPNWPLDSDFEARQIPQLRSHDLVWSNHPFYKWGWRRDPPTGGSYHLASPTGPRLRYFEARADPPNRGLWPRMVQSTPLQGGQEEDPHRGAAYILQAMASTQYLGRADPPIGGLMTLIWSIDPSTSEVEERPNQGSYHLTKPFGPQLNLRTRTDPPIGVSWLSCSQSTLS